MADPRDKIERTYRRAFDLELARAFKRLADDLKAGTPLSVVESQAELYFDKAKTRENLFGLYQEAMRAGAKEMEAVIARKSFDPELFSQEFWRDEFWQRHAFSRLDLVLESNRQAIIQAVSQLRAVEVSAQDLITTLTRLGRQISEVRAIRIVRTETTSAFNYSLDKVARDFGTGNLVAVWSAAKNPKTRPSHAEADGQERGQDGYFRVGSALLRYPGDPECDVVEEVVNCRCRLNYRRK